MTKQTSGDDTKRRDERMSKRTKEDLIEAARREAERDFEEGVGAQLGAAVVDLAAGCTKGVLAALAATVGWYWRRTIFEGFLARVDEQGRLREVGWIELPSYGNARACERGRAEERCVQNATHTIVDGPGPRPYWCATHAPGGAVPHPDLCLDWHANEHLDDVLRAGAERVAARTLAALEKPTELPKNIATAVSVLKPGELLVLEAAKDTPRRDVDRLLRRLDDMLSAMDSKGILLEGPVTRESVEHLRGRLREVGLDVVPAIRWEDVRSWLLSIGFQEAAIAPDDGAPIVTFRRGAAVMNICWVRFGEDDLSWIADVLQMPVRAMRETITRHAEKPVRKALAEEAHVDAAKARVGALRRHGHGQALRDGASKPMCGKCGGPAEVTPQGPTMVTLASSGEHQWAASEVCATCLRAMRAMSPDLSGWLIRAGRIVPREAPLQVTTASGRVVDLRDPANIRRGMVFWADVYFQLPGMKFTCGERDTGNCWQDAHDRSLGTCPSSSAERFLGCDPTVASAEDVTEFGSVHTQEGLDAIAKDFGTEPTSLDELRKPRAYHKVMLEAEQPENEPAPIATFADLLAAGRPARVLVLEPDLAKWHMLIERLVKMGGGAAGRASMGVHFRDGVRVDTCGDPKAAVGYSCDVAVGFRAGDALRLLRGSGVALSVFAEDAPRFWGMAPKAAVLDEDAVLEEIRVATGLPRGELHDVSFLTMEMVDAAAKKLGVTSAMLLDKLHDMVNRALLMQGAAPITAS